MTDASGTTVVAPPSSAAGPAASGTAPRRREYPALTGLRIVAALWVVLYHAGPALSPVLQGPLSFLWPVVRAGWLGVDLFFVLSGFVIANAYVQTMGRRFEPRLVARFLWARFARIWPVWVVVSALFVVLLFVIGAAHRTGGASAPVTLGNTVEQLLMVQVWTEDGIEGSSYVVPGWSLSAEWLAYVCFPVLALGLSRLRKLPVLVLAGLSFLALMPSAYLAWTLGDSADRWQVRIIGGFLAGVLMGMAVAATELTARAERLAAIGAAVAVGELVVMCWWADSQQPAQLASVSVLCIPLLVGSLAMSRSGLARPLCTPLLQLGGKISYSLYLVHSLVLVSYDQLAANSTRLQPGGRLYTFLMPQLVLVSLLVAWVVWRWVEEPCRIWLLARGPAAPATVAARRHAASGVSPLTPVPAVPAPRYQPDLEPVTERIAPVPAWTSLGGATPWTPAREPVGTAAARPVSRRRVG